MTRRRYLLVILIPLSVGAALLAVAMLLTDFHSAEQLLRRLGGVAPLILAPGAAWHLLRTWGWRRCFPADQRPTFGRVFRVRLAAEAVSYVTIRGVAGEPLKVGLLDGEVRPSVASAAVALERVAYILTTAAILAISAGVALATIPLTHGWRMVFAGLMTGAVLMVAAALALLARGPRPVLKTAGARSRIRRFLVEFDEQLRRAVRDRPGDLVVLLGLESLAYTAMALEVWVVFRLVDVPGTFIDAVTVETLTRAATFASAFIPANLGALEASNVVAATAVNAAAGAAALAVARRLRGMFWCAAGFIVYPYRRSRASRRQQPINGPRAIMFLEDADSDVLISDYLGGMPIGERLMRAAERAGYRSAFIWAARQKAVWERILQRSSSSLELHIAGDEDEWRRELARLPAESIVTVVAPNVIPLPRLLAAVSGDDVRANGVFRASLDQMRSPAEAAALHVTADAPRTGPPDGVATAEGGLVSLCIRSRADLIAAEHALRASIFKPTDGIFGRFNRRMSIPISIALIRRARLSAHAMSIFVLATGCYAGWLFSRGSYLSGVGAGLVSLAASILDGCDGELARLQYSESAFGCWLDTLGDYVYYISIFVGLTVGVSRQHASFTWIGGFLLVGLVITLALLIVLRGQITQGQPERLRATTNAHFYNTGHAWTAAVARLSMCATRATMPYGVMVFAVFNLLPVFLILAAIGAHIFWISLAFQLKSLLHGARLTGTAVGPSIGSA